MENDKQALKNFP